MTWRMDWEWNWNSPKREIFREFDFMLRHNIFPSAVCSEKHPNAGNTPVKAVSTVWQILTHKIESSSKFPYRQSILLYEHQPWSNRWRKDEKFPIYGSLSYWASQISDAMKKVNICRSSHSPPPSFGKDVGSMLQIRLKIMMQSVQKALGEPNCIIAFVSRLLRSTLEMN